MTDSTPAPAGGATPTPPSTTPAAPSAALDLSALAAPTAVSGSPAPAADDDEDDVDGGDDAPAAPATTPAATTAPTAAAGPTREQLLAQVGILLAEGAALRAELQVARDEAAANRPTSYTGFQLVKLAAGLLVLMLVISYVVWPFVVSPFLRWYFNSELKSEYEAIVNRLELEHNTKLEQQVSTRLEQTNAPTRRALTEAQAEIAGLSREKAELEEAKRLLERTVASLQADDDVSAVQLACQQRDAAVAQLASFTRTRDADVAAGVAAVRAQLVREHREELELSFADNLQLQQRFIAARENAALFQALLNGDYRKIGTTMPMDVVVHGPRNAAVNIELQGSLCRDDNGAPLRVPSQSGAVRAVYPNPSFYINVPSDLYTVVSRVGESANPAAHVFLGESGGTVITRLTVVNRDGTEGPEQYNGDPLYRIDTFRRGTLLVLMGASSSYELLPNNYAGNMPREMEGRRILENGRYGRVRNGQIEFDRPRSK